MSAIQVSPWWRWAPVLHVTPSTVRVSPLRWICFACWVAEGKHFNSCFTLCWPIFSGIPRQYVQLQPGKTDGGWLLYTKGNVIRLVNTTNHQPLFYWYFNTWNPLQHPNYIKITSYLSTVSLEILYHSTSPSPDTNLRTCHQLLPYRGPIHRDHGYYDSVEDEVLGWDTPKKLTCSTFWKRKIHLKKGPKNKKGRCC